MKIFLLMVSFISCINASAQALYGHYSVVGWKFANLQTEDEVLVYSKFMEICPDSKFRSIGRMYFCATLDIFEDNSVFFQIGYFFDTGNTRSVRTGDYLVALTASGENTYVGKNKFIDLTLTVRSDEVEVFVNKRVEKTLIKGIVNRLENKMIPDLRYYIFKKSEDNPQITYSEAKSTISSLIDDIGINYGPYRVVQDKVIWEDITQWSSKEEITKLEKVDIESFEVYTHDFNKFYVIDTNCRMLYPCGYTDFAKDRERVYYQGEVIEGVNPSVFYIVDPLYAKTNKSVYYKNTIIHNANVETFKSINGGYAMDKSNFYKNGQIVKKDETIKELLKKL